MNIQVELSSVQHAQATLLASTYSGTFAAPSLAGYSPVPSLQLVATEHSAAITGSPGSATVVELAISGEVQWSAGNLQSMITAVESHEALASRAFTDFNPLSGEGRVQSTAESVYTSFGGRPAFNPGSLVFTPAVIGPELAESAESLLSKFTATNDAAVGDAINFWTTYAGRMTDLSTDLVTAAQRLLADNSGAAINAAVKYLVSLSSRVTQVSASAGIIAGHLGVLPAVRGMAIAQLGAIEAEAAVITDPAAREAFERSAIAAFLTGPYMSELQAAVPTIPNLTQPELSVSVAKSVQSGLNGGNGLAGASQAGLSPTGMAASGATSAASAVPAATSGPISGPNGMSPAGSPMSPSTPMSPTSGATPTIPGTAPMTPAGATSPAGAPSAAMPMGPTAMNPAATSPASGFNTSASTPRGPNGAGLGGVSGGGVPTSSVARPSGIGGGLGRGAPGSAGIGGAGRGSGASADPGGRSGSSAASLARTPGAQATGRGGSSATGAAGASGAAQSPYRRGNSDRDADVGGIRGTANDYEQDEYQRELFGEEPVTVPALIGRNVRG